MLKRYVMILLAIMLLVSVGVTQAQSLSERFQYLHPIPGSILVSKSTTIIMRTGDYVTSADISAYNKVKITGSESGNHSYELIVSTDDKTAILKPFTEFTPGEVVTVDLLNGSSFSFTISGKTGQLLTEQDWIELAIEAGEISAYPSYQSGLNTNLVTNDDPALPSDFPIVDVTVNEDPDGGYVFLANHGSDAGATDYLMILENDGTPIFYRKIDKLINDFKRSRTDLLTYCEFLRSSSDNAFYAMDQTYTVVDSFRTGNGYSTDQHAFQLLDDYHCLITSYDPQTVDMSDSIEGGNSEATVIGFIVQELDSLKNVVFEWRSWDHFSIMDSPFINYTSSRIDYVHGNSVELTPDDNIVISCRSFHEITKINRSSGDIIWRCGLNAINNEFTFVADSAGFTSQHDARILDNGNLTCYDNGNYHTPQFSRAVEYELDESAMTATLVWEFRDSPDIYGPAQGGAHRTSTDNTIISWGSNAGVTATEVTSEGTKVFEVNLGNEGNIQNSYRAFRFPWTGIANKPYLTANQADTGIHLVFDQFGDYAITEYAIYVGESANPTTPIDTTAENYYYLTDLPNGLTYYIRVSGIDYSGIEGDYSNEVEITMPNLYTPGDVNGDDIVVGGDVTSLVNYFRGLSTMPDSCWNPNTSTWLHASGDVTGDCLVIGGDVTYLVNYFRGLCTLTWCEDVPPYGY